MKQPRWLWRSKQKEALKVRLIDRPITHLRADEFRADAELVHLAAVALQNPNLQLMLSVMRNEHPGNEVLTSEADSIQRVVHQARGEGWTMALATLESLGVKATLPDRLVSSFGVTDQPSTNP